MPKEFICEVCEKPIEGNDIDERHDMHREGCQNKDGDHENGCDCDMPVHAECCLDCAAGENLHEV